MEIKSTLDFSHIKTVKAPFVQVLSIKKSDNNYIFGGDDGILITDLNFNT